MDEVLAELLPWVLGFYALDGFVQLRRGHVLAAGSGALRPLRAGLQWLGLSPAAEAVALFDLPYLRRGERIWVLDPKRRSEPAVVEPQDLKEVDLAAAGKVDRLHRSVTVGDTHLLEAPSTALAASLAAALSAAPSATPRRRGADRTDLRAARALRLRLRPWRLILKVLASVLGAIVLVAAPLVTWTPLSAYPLALPILREAAVLLLAIAVTGVAYLRVAGRGWWASVGGGLALLLPWEGLHPLVHLSRSAYRRFDALTALAALLRPADFHALAARELVRARLSRERTPPALAPAWQEREQHLARLLAGTGSSVEQALAPPAAEADSAAYCPLCRTAYREGFATCADCGVALEGLPRASRASTVRQQPS
jgi:hypothetical protein